MVAGSLKSWKEYGLWFSWPVLPAEESAAVFSPVLFLLMESRGRLLLSVFCKLRVLAPTGSFARLLGSK